MSDALFIKVCSKKNLQIALKRIQTSQNLEYKNYYRELFLAYGISEDKNLENLSERLKNGSFRPSKGLRFYIPKSSGLQRPITFLHLDDLIVYQACANVLAEKFMSKRMHLENRNVFSNILNQDKDKDIFFFRKWSESYTNFLKKIKFYYNRKIRWVAHFDLAAYYETISHDNFCHQVSRNSYEHFLGMFRKCLETWSSSDGSSKIKQGIPQGPISSSLIGELYMLPIDILLRKKNVKYVRYVDDIKIFGKTREEVLKGIILLERACKESGLIPQSQKYAIIKAESIEDAIGKAPSLTAQEKKKIPNSEAAAILFKASFKEKQIDISKIKYILKVCGLNRKILKIVLKNLNKHPELAEPFCNFLSLYSDNDSIGNYIFDNTIKNPSMYDYVEGKYWELLSKFNLDSKIKQKAIDLSIERLKKSKNSYSLKLGIYEMLCSTNTGLVINWLKTEESALIQAFVIPHIHETCFGKPSYIGLLNVLWKRSNYEPALASLSQILYTFNFELLDKLPISKKDKSGVINNTLGKPENIDPLGQILEDRYGVRYFNKWRKFLDKDYSHANYMLFLSENAFYSNRSAWIGNLDSFNDFILRKYIELRSLSFPLEPLPKIINKKGDKIDYGVILYNYKKLGKHLILIDSFQALHMRRSSVPASHPIDRKSGKKSEILKSVEQRKFLNSLRNGYQELIDELSKIIN